MMVLNQYGSDKPSWLATVRAALEGSTAASDPRAKIVRDPKSREVIGLTMPPIEETSETPKGKVNVGYLNLKTGEYHDRAEAIKPGSTPHHELESKIISGPETTTGTVQYKLPSPIAKLVDRLSKKYGLDSELMKRMVFKESQGKPTATSHRGAQGLMQLMPDTQKTYGVTDPYDPVQNLSAGMKHFKDMLNEFGGNTRLALAAYNAGEPRVKKLGTVPNIKETQDYVKAIAGEPSTPASQPTEIAPATIRPIADTDVVETSPTGI